jgi:hypothetical protein
VTDFVNGQLIEWHGSFDEDWKAGRFQGRLPREPGMVRVSPVDDGPGGGEWGVAREENIRSAAPVTHVSVTRERLSAAVRKLTPGAPDSYAERLWQELL